MNRKGQVLVLFVMILPIIFFLIYFVYNKIYLYGEKKNQEDLAYRLCSYYKDGKSIDNLKILAKKNDKESTLKIKKIDNKIEITLVKVLEDVINKKNKIRTVITCN